MLGFIKAGLFIFSLTVALQISKLIAYICNVQKRVIHSRFLISVNVAIHQITASPRPVGGFVVFTLLLLITNLLIKC